MEEQECNIQVSDIQTAHIHLRECQDINFHTKIEKNLKLSEIYKCNMYLKREDAQQARIFKVRGIYNRMLTMTPEEKKNGVICSSDGNMAQVVAYFCKYFQIHGIIIIPEVTFTWKVQLIKKYGREYIDIKFVGDCYEDSENEVSKICKEKPKLLKIRNTDDPKIIAGYGTIAVEIIEDLPCQVDYMILPIGRGALAAGICIYFNQISPSTKIIGVEPSESASMTAAFKNNKPVKLPKLSRFCDGSSCAWASELGYKVCKKSLHQLKTVPDGHVSTTILRLYELGIVVEPSGALAVSVLDDIKKDIVGKNVVCLISGGTVDLSRFDEFKEFSLIHEGLKYFFLITLPFKSGILREFVTFCLGPNDEISHIQFQKKQNRERGPMLVAIEVQNRKNIEQIKQRMDKMKIVYKQLNDTMDIYDLLV